MDITEQPPKSLTIQDMAKMPIETLVMNQALSNGSLLWLGNGIVMTFSNFQATDKMIHEQIEGHFHWVLLEYSLDLKNYKATLNADKLNREVPIIDMSHNEFYQEVAKYILAKEDK